MPKNILRYIGIASILFLSIDEALSQEGFGTQEPDKSSVIDMKSDKRGLLIPRVQLMSTTNSIQPVLNPAHSLLVYNTATVSDVKPGYHYFKRDEATSSTNFDGVWITLTPGDIIGDVVINIEDKGEIYDKIVEIHGAPLKSFLKYKISSGFSLLSLQLLNDYRGINFPASGRELDRNNEYHEATGTYTAKQDGVYSISLQADNNGAVSAAEFGVGIFKTPAGSSTTVLLAEDRYLSVNVKVLLINLDVSPPTRYTQTLVELKEGDKIQFGVKTPLLAANVLVNYKAQFSIHQVE